MKNRIKAGRLALCVWVCIVGAMVWSPAFAVEQTSPQYFYIQVDEGASFVNALKMYRNILEMPLDEDLKRYVRIVREGDLAKVLVGMFSTPEEAGGVMDLMSKMFSSAEVSLVKGALKTASQEAAPVVEQQTAVPQVQAQQQPVQVAAASTVPNAYSDSAEEPTVEAPAPTVEAVQPVPAPAMETKQQEQAEAAQPTVQAIEVGAMPKAQTEPAKPQAVEKEDSGGIMDGLKEWGKEYSSQFNDVMFLIKLAAVLAFGLFGYMYIFGGKKKGNNKGAVLGDGVPWMLEPSKYMGALKGFREIKHLFLNKETDAKIFMITAPNPGAGVTTLTMNLGLVLARDLMDQKILIVDGNIAMPGQHKLFEKDLSPGLQDYILNDVSFEGVVHNTVLENLDLVTTGVSNDKYISPFDLKPMETFLQMARDTYDIILVDGDSVLRSTDSRSLSNKADGVIVVCEASKTRREVLVEIKKQLDSDGARVVGGILNKREFVIPSWVYKFI